MEWQIQPHTPIPQSFLEQVGAVISGSQGGRVAELLWQRGIDQEDVPGFLNPDAYTPTSPLAFGQEIERAIRRLEQAYNHQEKLAIWGDFDADGLTATAILWQGLGQWFTPEQQLTYFIPDRLTESHGLSLAGVNNLAAQGVTLLITCDTGSTNLAELRAAQALGLDVVVTDHHTLPSQRPDCLALVNPRSLPTGHPLAHLSGVAVAFKLLEALQTVLPPLADPLDHCLDLVAIGLIADLVTLRGDCRYLAQRGLQQLQTLTQPQGAARRPGVAHLLKLCKRTGDRPSDIAFGIGPRINAVSRIQGDTRLCIALLTSRDPQRCQELAQQVELLNTRRRAEL
jgi:single-stranded-DNA-specific exonuclease